MVVDGGSSGEVIVESSWDTSGHSAGPTPLFYCMSTTQLGKDTMVKTRLFADDCIVYRRINDSDDSKAL